MRRTTIYLPDSLKARVARVARERDIPEAGSIRTAIDEFTRTGARPRPMLPLFETVGAADLSERVDEALAQGFGRD